MCVSGFIEGTRNDELQAYVLLRCSQRQSCQYSLLEVRPQAPCVVGPSARPPEEELLCLLMTCPDPRHHATPCAAASASRCCLQRWAVPGSLFLQVGCLLVAAGRAWLVVVDARVDDTMLASLQRGLVAVAAVAVALLVLSARGCACVVLCKVRGCAGACCKVDFSLPCEAAKA